VILDLEDGVAPARKTEGRAGALKALETRDFSARERLLRINALDSPWGRDDLSALRTARSRPDTVIIPKINGPEQVRKRRAGGHNGDAAAPHRDGAGPARRRRHRRVSSSGGRSLLRRGRLAGRNRWAAHADDALVSAIGRHRRGGRRRHRCDRPPYFRQRPSGLEAAEAAANSGLRAKPRSTGQIAVLNRIFTPSPERVAWAERVMTIAEQDSRGAFVVDGEMADAMTVRVARRVLATARALQAAGHGR
jgi:citrate lyase beta subunit